MKTADDFVAEMATVVHRARASRKACGRCKGRGSVACAINTAKDCPDCGGTGVDPKAPCPHGVPHRLECPRCCQGDVP